MSAAEELATVDAEWDVLAAGAFSSASEKPAAVAAEPPKSSGTFGHPSERRLGLRTPATLWALVKEGQKSAYARTVELSPTSTVLKLVDRGVHRFDRARRFELDLFVPGATRPLHAVAWPARAIGDLQAFEFLTMSSADRLSLAEHLDHLASTRQSSSPPIEERSGAAPPVTWRNFVLSLKQRRTTAPAQRL